MVRIGYLLTVFSFLQFTLSAALVETFYGPLEIEERVLLDLIDSPPMQRLKEIHQYGDSYYTTHPEEYTRYDHSLGVFAVLRLKGASLEEQIAGLLHDISHTVFSHVGDYLFGFESAKDAYQDSVHEWFLEKYGIADILKMHGLSAKQVLHKSGDFPALEQELPNLCADRIDYNIQGACLRGMITKEESLAILDDLKFVDGKWISTKPELIKKIVKFSLCMTRDCWGSARSYLTSCWLASALKESLNKKILSVEDVSFGTDNLVWNTLLASGDPTIQEYMFKIAHAEAYFTLVSPEDADLTVRRKFRGVDPWIQKEGEIHRLTEVDREVAREYEEVKNLMNRGWSIAYKRT